MINFSKTETAFKHPKCGGVIVKWENEGTIYFECEKCAETAEDIDRLVLHSLVIIRKGTSKELK